MKSHAANNFDFVRLVAASLVIVGHGYALNGLASPGFFTVSIGTYAVKIFFVLSGFLVAKSWVEDPNLLRFMARRALRIFPALIGVTLLTVFVLGPVATSLSVSHYFSSRQTWGYLENIAMYIHYNLPGVFSDNVYKNAVNGSLWTLPVEFFMYILLAFVGVVFGSKYFKYGCTAALLIFVAVGYYLFSISPTPPARTVLYGTDVMASLTVAPYFVMGAFLYVARGRVLFDLGIALVVLLVGLWLISTRLQVEPLLLVVTSYCVISFGLASSPFFSRAGRFGDLSYGIYIYGFPVEQVVSWRLHGHAPVALQILISLCCTAALAFASWRLIEKPALTLKPRGPARDKSENDARELLGVAAARGVEVAR